MGASGSSLLKGVAKFIGKNGAKAGAHVAGGLANNMGSVVPAVFLLNMSGKLIEFIEDVSKSLKESTKTLDASTKNLETKQDMSKYAQSAKHAGTFLKDSVNKDHSVQKDTQASSDKQSQADTDLER